MQAAATSYNRTYARSIPLRRARFWLICFFFVAWAGVISTRLFWLQIVRHHEYMDRAQKEQQRTFEVAPRRGVLYDRNLHELAMTVQVDSIYADPSEIDDKKAEASALAKIVHVDEADASTTEEQIDARLAKNNGFAWIARRVRPEVSTRVKALNLKGIYFQKEFQREYPNDDEAAQVLGYVGVDDNGLGGLEKKFEPELHGTPGRMYTAMDARRKVLGSSERDPQPGQSLVLTIDQTIQYMAERALDHVMEKTHADHGTVVIQDVHTGQILALAVRPTFNPNQRHTTPELLRNNAISNVYEPGSTFKLVAYSAALDQGAVKPDDMVDCQGGQITLAGRVIHDNQGEHYGVIPVHKALEVSSDVGAIKMALKVGQDKFSNYVRAYGFGSRSGVELPGETRGLLRPVNKWSGSSIGSIAMGQEIGVTPVQLVSMVSTIANGGVYLPPHILMSAPSAGTELTPAPFKPGGQLPNPLPTGAHRVISTMAAAQMRQMMEGVVLYGTGKDAMLNGYSAGGKTGTAQKVDPATHKYSKTMHVASFAGIAPVNNPVIAVAVVMDNPKGGGSYYGGAVSAPVFAEVAQQVLEYLGVPHDQPVRAEKQAPVSDKSLAEDDHDGGDVNAMYAALNDLPSDDPLRDTQQQQSQQSAGAAAQQSNKPATNAASAAAMNSSGNAPGTQTQVAANSSPPAKPASVSVPTGATLKVPSLVGLNMRQVILASNGAGLEVDVTGSGTVREQAPAAGTMVPPGTRIVVHCAR